MNLPNEEIDRLNKLLKDKKIRLPSHRKEVDYSGRNYKWLQKHILRSNPTVSDELLGLLDLRTTKKQKKNVA